MLDDNEVVKRKRTQPQLTPRPITDQKAVQSSSTHDLQNDREWYGGEENGAAVDLYHNEFLGMSEEQTAQLEQRKHPLIMHQPKRFSARHEQRVRDTDRWESSRLAQSGLLGGRQGFRADEDDDHKNGTVQLIVHERTPPFLPAVDESEQANYIRDSSGIKVDPVNPVRDPTSDIAQMARRGSLLVRELRERRERAKKMKSLEGQGTTLGGIMGRPHSVEEEEEMKTSKDQGKRFSELLASQESTSDFATKKSLKEQRQFLPAFAVRDQLMKVIRENQVVIVVGETGSGKTTQLAQFLDEDGFTHGGRFLIGCTQPRRVAAVSVAKRVAEEMGSTIGETVGYAIRFEDCVSEKTRIKFMTDGVLLRESLRDPDLDNYAAVIIDEAHERSLQTDVLLGLLKKIVSRRFDLRVIVTSATMDSQRFSQFFANAPIFTIPGRTFPVECLYSKIIPEDYVDAAVKQVLAVHVGHPPGDILVFMTGQEDIEATCAALQEKLEEHLKDAVSPLLILPIYSQLPADLQAKIFEKAPEDTRKCIVATNIAETSLTVDGIRYVIDTGLSKVKVYNAKIGMDALTIAPVSQAAANQRAGRAGRTGPGVCFRLYPETTFHHDLLAAAIPEIQRTNLSNVVLLLKSLGVEDVSKFDFIDSPPQAALRTALSILWTLGCLDDVGRLTPLGRKMVEFPLDPPLSKMLLVADALGCVSDVLTIVSMLSVPNVFQRPKERMEEADAMREKFSVPESDLLTLLNVYQQWLSNGKRDSWSMSHFIHAKALQRAHEVHEQLYDILTQQKISIVNKEQNSRNWDSVRKCIAASNLGRAARMHGLGQYANLRTGMPCHLHPTSSIFGLGFTPEFIVYHELIMTSKEYMQGVTVVEPAWLAEAGPMIYSLRITENNQNSGSFAVPTRKVINFSDISSPLRLGSFAPHSDLDGTTVEQNRLKKSIECDDDEHTFVIPGKRSRSSNKNS